MIRFVRSIFGGTSDNWIGVIANAVSKDELETTSQGCLKCRILQKVSPFSAGCSKQRGPS